MNQEGPATDGHHEAGDGPGDGVADRTEAGSNAAPAKGPDRDAGRNREDGTMTLAFDVDALEAVADLEAVFEDARTWSRYVGVVSDRMAYQVVNYLREQGVYSEDFFSRASKERGLVQARKRTDTDRYVLVGQSEEAARIAAREGWEYLAVEEAAAAADWELATGSVEH